MLCIADVLFFNCQRKDLSSGSPQTIGHALLFPGWGGCEPDPMAMRMSLAGTVVNVQLFLLGKAYPRASASACMMQH